MKRVLVLSLGLLISVSALAVDQEVMNCSPKQDRADIPTFVVKKTRFSGISKKVGADRVKPVAGHAHVLYVNGSPSSQVVVQAPVKRDNTFILTADHGSLGYAHIYTDGDKTIVDVNHRGLGGLDGVNTEGPQTSYTCR